MWLLLAYAVARSAEFAAMMQYKSEIFADDVTANKILVWVMYPCRVVVYGGLIWSGFKIGWWNTVKMAAVSFVVGGLLLDNLARRFIPRIALVVVEAIAVVAVLVILANLPARVR